MPKIPLYDHQSQPTQPQNVRANPGMLEGQAQAAQRLGSAIAGAGDVVADVAFKLQRAQNFKATAELQTVMETTWGEFQNELVKHSDETTWREAWTKKFDAAVGKFTARPNGPVLRDEMEARIASFRARSLVDIDQQAKGAAVERATIAGNTRVESMWRNGDAAGAEATLNEMAALDLIAPESIPERMRRGQVLMEQDQALKIINTDPIGAIDVLTDRTEGGKPRNFAHLDEADRYSLITQAERNASQLRATTYQGLIDRMNAGELMTKDELDGMVERKLLTATQSQSILRQQKAGKIDQPAFADLSRRILTYDPATDGTRTEYAKLMAETLGFPDAVRGQLISDLNKRDDPSNRLNSPAARDIFQRAEADYRAGLFLPWATAKQKVPGTGLLGTGILADKKDVMVQPPAEVLKGWKDGTLAKDVRDATSTAYAEYLTRMRDFIDRNPKATDAEIEQYSQTLRRPYVISAMTATIQQAVPVGPARAITTKEDYDALPSGARFVWKGREGVKP